ncbi:MAG TPA: hypothetical protein VL738_31490 [Dactylosporangium sp.]|nr:hypothetical protein [Dactylosporangium sp.]
MAERVTAARLMLVSVVGHWFYLEKPTFIRAGQTYWVDWGAGELCVDRGDGRAARHARATHYARWMAR